MRKILKPVLVAAAVVAAAFIALLAVVAIRTALSRSKQLHVPAVVAASPLSGFADRLAAALRLPTIADESPGATDPAPFLALHDLLAESFPLAHEHLEREVRGGLSLLYRWEGSDPSRAPILLMSHLDVVPVEDEADWTHPPFSGEIAEGFIWGRGALDVKCGALGLLEAVERLLSDRFRPACDVYLALGHDEERGGNDGNRRIADALRDRGVRFRFVLDEGGGITRGIIGGIDEPVALVGIAEKGYARVVLTAEGPGGHSSMPPRRTPVGQVAEAVHRLESSPPPSRLDGATGAMLDYLGPEMPPAGRAILANRWLTGGLIARQFSAEPSLNALIRTTTTATVIRGGETANVIPTHADAIINLRTLPGEDAESALGRIASLIEGTRVSSAFRGGPSEASALSPIDSDDFRALHRTIAELYPDVVVTPGLPMVATDSRHYAPIAEATYRFLPLSVTAEDLGRIHGRDERIAVEDYAKLIGFLARLIQNVAPAAGEGHA